MKKANYFWIEYNGKYIAEYKSVRACINFISRKSLFNDCDNVLDIVDNNGDFYNVITGEKLKI